MSGVFRNIDPHPLTARRVCNSSPLLRGEDTLAGWRGGGGSIFWKTRDTALYSTYVSTLWCAVCQRTSTRLCGTFWNAARGACASGQNTCPSSPLSSTHSTFLDILRMELFKLYRVMFNLMKYKVDQSVSSDFYNVFFLTFQAIWNIKMDQSVSSDFYNVLFSYLSGYLMPESWTSIILWRSISLSTWIQPCET